MKINIKNLKTFNFIKMCLVAIIAAVFSIIFGTLIGLIDFDFSSLHLVVMGLIWITNVLVSYSISYLIGLLFKVKFKFFSPIAMALSYTASVIAVILISGTFDYLYVTSYLSAVTIIGIVYGIYGLYKSKKKIMNRHHKNNK